MQARSTLVKGVSVFISMMFIVILCDAQISIVSFDTPLTQDFNSLSSSGSSSTLPTGWVLAESGTNANTTYTAGTGSSNTGDTYSFGSASSTERAFGGLQSGNLIPTIGAQYTNNTGDTIGSMSITYTGEQWRLGTTGRQDRLDFQYSLNATSLTTGDWIDVDALDFLAPITSGTAGALDGNADANNVEISFDITNLTILHGGSFWIRWTDFNATSSDDGLSADDFSLTPCEPQTSCSTLPLRLLYFNVERTGTSATIDWTTDEEINNSHFEIQRASTEDKTFKTLSVIEAAVNHRGLNQYQYSDHLPAKGINYYRLKQVDQDGSFTFSPVKEIHFYSNDPGIRFFPNPAQHTIYISIDNDDVPGKLQLLNMAGLAIRSISLDADEDHYELAIENLPGGVYMLVYVTNQNVATYKVMITN